MRVLINLKNGPAQKYVVTLNTKALIKEVLDLVHSHKHHQAVMKALGKGRLEREISADDIHRVKADLILTEKDVRWDLTK